MGPMSSELLEHEAAFVLGHHGGSDMKLTFGNLEFGGQDGVI